MARNHGEGKGRLEAGSSSDSLRIIGKEARECRACPLWKRGTQTVFGEGKKGAALMLVGEQPGDKEDLAGKPFVGPAGALLDSALEAAGIDRPDVFVTNAVKHFKWIQRGKRRLHQKPALNEIQACRPWLESEMRAVQPKLILAMGVTAAISILGKAVTIRDSRGKVFLTESGIAVMVTVHPSAILRADDKDRAKALEEFIDDLKRAKDKAKK